MVDRVRTATIAKMTGLSVRKVQEMALSGKLPGAAKLGGTWTFDPNKVEAWIRDEEAAVARRGNRSLGVCRLTADTHILPDESIALRFAQLIYGKPKSGSRRGR